jgi:hypothetical protein
LCTSFWYLIIISSHKEGVLNDRTIRNTWAKTNNRMMYPAILHTEVLHVIDIPIHPENIRRNNEIHKCILERHRTFQCPSSVSCFITTNNLTLMWLVINVCYWSQARSGAISNSNLKSSCLYDPATYIKINLYTRKKIIKCSKRKLTLMMQPSPMTLSVISALFILDGGKYRGWVYMGADRS